MDIITFSDMEAAVLEYTDPSMFFDLDEENEPITRKTLRYYIEYIISDYIKEMIICDIRSSDLPEEEQWRLIGRIEALDIQVDSSDILDFYANRTHILDVEKLYRASV